MPARWAPVFTGGGEPRPYTKNCFSTSFCVSFGTMSAERLPRAPEVIPIFFKGVERCLYRTSVSGPSWFEADASRRGWFVHSVLLFGAREQKPLGLIEQERWIRQEATRGKRHRRKKRKYEEKESYKWQRASERVLKRLGDEVSQRVISVCDREADVYEYIDYKNSRGQRFVVRASWNRKLAEKEGGYLWGSLEGLEPKDGGTVHLAQRGGRPKRDARLSMRYRKVTLHPPKRDGRVGWLLLWRGWSRLMERVVGFKVALQLTGRSEL